MATAVRQLRVEPDVLGLAGELLWIPVESISVDARYQRPLNTRWVSEIARGFDPVLLGVVLVSERDDGSRYALDGQHRIEAIRLREQGEALLPAMVYKGLSLELEAHIFAETNRNQLKLQPGWAFRARLLAGDKNAHAIKGIVEEYGFHLNLLAPGENWREEGRLYAIGELETIFTNSATRLHDTLALARDAWGSDVTGLSASILRGFSIFLIHWGAVIERERLLRILEATPPRRLEGEGRDKGRYLGGKTPAGVAEYLRERYNYRAGKTKRLPERNLRQPVGSGPRSGANRSR
jgi:hypothetical protein